MYIMESDDEARRLLAQEQADEPLLALLRAGLRPGDRVLDAGCGPGLLTAWMADLVGPSGQVTGIDLSAERLAEASRLNAGRPQVCLLRRDIRHLELPEASVDYAFSQFVLEYLPDRGTALAELIRVTRPGGRVVVSEIDGFGMSNWPFPEPLRHSCERFVEALGRTGFDFHVGRKLFHEFRQAGLREVRVQVLPQYVVAGPADARLARDWELRFAALSAVVAPAFPSPSAYQEFCRDYLRMLADSDTLKYSVRLVTEGIRP